MHPESQPIPSLLSLLGNTDIFQSFLLHLSLANIQTLRQLNRQDASEIIRIINTDYFFFFFYLNVDIDIFGVLHRL